MTPAAHSSDSLDEPLSLVARIDAQDVSYVTPLREYLEANDCRVIVNGKNDTPVRYHIVAGDCEFVKEIFSYPGNPRVASLGIIVDSHCSDAETFISSERKIIVVDPVPLTPEDVINVFYFFFAEKNQFADKRRNRHVPVHVRPVIGERGKRGVSNSDTTRIESLMREVFDGEEIRTKEKKRRVRRKKGVRLVTWMLTAIIAWVLVPTLWYVMSLSLAVSGFVVSGKHIISGDLSRTTRYLDFGSYWVSQGRLAFVALRIPLALVGLPETIRGQERTLSFLDEAEGILREGAVLVDAGKRASAVLVSSESNQSVESVAVLLKTLQLSVTSLMADLGLAQAQLTTLVAEKSFPFFLPPVNDKGRRAIAVIVQARQILTVLDQMLSFYPTFAGFTRPQTYLVLLQNSAELRPTGGFVGSVGILVMDGGVMKNFSVQDVYAIDGQLKGHVDPPIPIRELLGQEHWYLRDSNWDPDFEISGEKAAWFYEKETEEHVDGVIAISLPFVTNLLKVTGPLVLSDYNEQVNAENFLGKSIYYTQQEFFPGSTQKRDFLGTLSRALMFEMSSDKTIQPLALFRALTEGLVSRDIQIMFRSEDDQALIRHFGWSGSVFAYDLCRGVDEGTCVSDPILVNEANVSVSKVNAFVRHEHAREITIGTDGAISERIAVTLENTAQDDARGVGGPYTTYIRFFVPTDATIVDVNIDGFAVPNRDQGRPASESLPYKERVISPASVQGLGIALSVPRGEKRLVTLSYARGVRLLQFGREGVLDIMAVKQAGLSDVVLKTQVNYPLPWQAISEEGGGILAKEGMLEYNTTLTKDVQMRVRFVK